ncbi:unnamed protein product [Anisakis simplex]|uniref:Phospholipase A2-like central domain-containing protein n=1 Tax=Anisakis simplex TaxID=6269 RepID=A0A3P6N221_ANISI|nr:unnamed protein product [Anisakis simplex]
MYFRCCAQHDACYDCAVREHECGSFDEYFYRYDWNCANPNQAMCQWVICECDKQLVECWKQYPFPTEAKPCVNVTSQPISSANNVHRTGL